MKIKVNLFSKSSLMLLLFAALTNFAALAQKTVTGTVTDAKGEGLVGATVVVTGTTKGTATDVEGKYSIEVPNDAKSLTFSYTGSETQTVAIGTGNVIDVKLSGNLELEAVTIVAQGYGSLKSKEVSSAIVNVRSEDFVKGAVNDPVGLLQGQVAGLQVINNTGDPNSGYTILLRGVSTAIGNPLPLFVIDGIPNVGLNSIDPNDIESIDVLKDGSASAIYGTRGSNGVLLITTKKGKSGAPTIDYNVQVNDENVLGHVKVMDAATYKANGGTDLGGNTDWLGAITQTAVSQIHNLALSGGVGGLSYRASFNYRNIQGVQIGTGNQTLNGHLSLTQKALNDKLTITGLLSVTGVDQQLGNLRAFSLATTTNPTMPIYSSDPLYIPYGGYRQQIGLLFNDNPYAISQQGYDNNNVKNNVYAVKADYQIVPGLTLGGIYMKNTSDNFEEAYRTKLDYYAGASRSGLATQSQNSESQDFFNSTLQYKTAIDAKTSLTLLGGYEYQSQLFAGQGLQAGNFLTDIGGADQIQNAKDLKTGIASVYSYKNSNKVISFFGRANLGYDDAYNLMVSLRRDGSTRFGINNKWGLFPAVAGSINLGKLLALSNIDLFKLRAGYGITGALPTSDGLSQSLVGQQSGSFLQNGSFGPVYGPTQNENPNIKWERKAEFNLGVDFSIMHNLTGSVDFFNRNVSDLLYNYTVSSTKYLASSLVANVGTLQSSGLEFALAYTPYKTKDFKWVTGLNATYNLSDKIISLSQGDLQFGSGGVAYVSNAGAPGLNSTNYIRIAEGQPIGQFFGYKWAGTYDSNGSPLYTKADGSTAIGKNIDVTKDGQVLGNGEPVFSLNWNNAFNLGNFDVSFLIRGVFGHDLINENRVFYEQNDASQIGQFNRVYTKYFDPQLKVSEFSSIQVEKGDFLQLNNFTVGYTFQLPKGSVFRKIRAYVSGNNLFYLTGYTGVSPEPILFDTNSGGAGVDSYSTGTNSTRFGGSNYLAPGIDRRLNYYTTRSFSLGMNVGF